MTPGIVIFMRCILFAFILPFLAGVAVTSLTDREENGAKKKEISLAFSFIAGYLLLWSLVELVSVPGTILKAPFRVMVYIILGCETTVGLYGIIVLIKGLKDKKGVTGNALLSVFDKKSNIVLFMIFVILFCIFVYLNITTLFYDADDSRFLVSAGDIVRNNHILSTDPVTGLGLDTGYRDFKKDLISQWAAFIACSSVVTGIDTTVFAHIFYPVIAMILIFSVYWLLFSEVTYENRFIVMIVLIAMFVFGNYSTHSQETVSIIRVWQGKATLAVFGVLCVIYVFMKIYALTDDKGGNKAFIGYCILLFLVNMSLSLMSSMGIVISAIMIMAYGIYLVIVKKKLRYIIPMIIICIPNALLYMLSELYSIERFLG